MQTKIVLLVIDYLFILTVLTREGPEVSMEIQIETGPNR